MLALVVYPIGTWAGFHRRPMLEALARNLVGKALILVVAPPLDGLKSLQSGEWREPARTVLRRIEQQSKNVWLLRSFKMPGPHQFHKGIARTVDWALRRLPSVTRVAALVFRPEQLACLGLASEDYVIYECYDEYRRGKDGELIPHVCELERTLLKQADLVLTTSKPLCESRSLDHSHVAYSPNGVDTRLFGKALGELQTPEDMANIEHPIIGYIGNIAWWLNFDLLETVAASMPQAQFVFIGPVSEQAGANRLDHHPNVHFLGLKPRSTLPGYLRQMNAALCPFHTVDYLQKARPLTILEYLSAGKATVTTPLAAIEDLLDVLYPATTPEEVLAAIGTALTEADEPEHIAARVQRAAANDWDVLTKKTADAILRACV